ncbi:F-box only protein 21 [Manduca sexta]|uniref:F-box only protein 21 n=1 Tax=Manduca sexta TaxID=7130 RepID=UPI00188F68E0|nr:F-box only protein 21 [Manduca sexta]
MTEMYYAKVVLCHLMHLFLSVKWAQKYNTNEMLPQGVLTFFLQWVNVVKLYNQDEVNNEINNLVRDVEMLLVPEMPKTSVPGEVVKQRVMKKILKQREVISAISQVVYRYRQIVVTPAMDLDTLNIIEVLKKKTGHVIAVAAIYQAIAAQCGIACSVIAFTNHFFLEWICTDDERKTQVHKINIETGEVLSNRRCPFSDRSADRACAYCANSLLRYIITSFTNTVGPGHLGTNNWYKQNAFLLYEFLNPEAAPDSPYYNYYRYLIHEVPLNLLSPIGIQYIENEHLQILSALTYLNAPANTCRSSRSIILKKRNSQIKYAVGMICFHKKYLYTGIIIGWDAICDASWSQHPEVRNLQFGPNQPFYNVIAADGSSRYVPQEKLVFVTNPQRMIQLEDFFSTGIYTF